MDTVKRKRRRTQVREAARRYNMKIKGYMKHLENTIIKQRHLDREVQQDGKNILKMSAPDTSFYKLPVHSNEEIHDPSYSEAHLSDQEVGCSWHSMSSFVGRNPISFDDRNRSNEEIRVPRHSTSSVVRRNPMSFDDRNRSVPSQTIPDVPSSPSPFNVPRRVVVQPLYTMKKYKLYKLTLDEDLLIQKVKTHYNDDDEDDDDKLLIDIIYSPLRDKMDSEPFRILSETAFNCLNDQRTQRPNIDHIIADLEKALKIQTELDNPQKSTSADANQVPGPSTSLSEEESFKHLMIPLADLQAATDNFTKTFIGDGSFGKVYKAKLYLQIADETTGEVPKRKRTTVAIKCIKKDKSGEEGFVAEIKLLTRCKDKNIVSLLGFCNEADKLILVYEYVSRGSLSGYLGIHSKLTALTWVQRLRICVDIARGLLYLHTSMKVNENDDSIVHRDVKSGNILLSKKWVAKIADFGLSKFQTMDEQQKTYRTQHLVGTETYICPEYRRDWKCTRAIDIYSFGVVLFEILSGKLAYDHIFLNEDKDGIAPVARRRFKDHRINEMVDPKIMEEVDEFASTLNKGPDQGSLETFLAIAHQCIAETRKERPAAKHVLEELEKALTFQKNKKDNLQMSFEEISMATQEFSSLIGQGGFGNVYKGEVTRGNERRTIVAKRFNNEKKKKREQVQGEHHFLMELEILFEYKHPNIIGIEGYCNENNEKIIVYEHAPEISLDRHLKKGSLTWTKRLKICIDVASGLAFLHGGAQTKEIVVHRDIKCSNILLTHDWKAKISDFGLSAITTINQKVISKVVGTEGYLDPQYADSGHFTEKTDIYSLGVVLFEILNGKLLVPYEGSYDKVKVSTTLNQIHDEGKIDSIVFKDIKEGIATESLSTFRMISSKCLEYDGEKRPTASQVLQELKKALEFQEDYELWKPRLPEDYEEIIKQSKSSTIDATETKKDIYNMLSKGILLQDNEVMFSLGSNGERMEMISAMKFSYRNSSLHKWRPVTESRFQMVAEMLDISNLMIQIKTTPKYLSADVGYGIYLVFKFCNSREFSKKPVYVNLKYKKGTQTLHSYFATWRDQDWMIIELDRFMNHKEEAVFDFTLESLSPFYCGDDAIYVEGIEFRAIDNMENQEILKSNSDVDQVQQFPTNNEEIFNRFENYDEDEKLFALITLNGKKHLMLTAKVALYNSLNPKLFESKSSSTSRFQEVIELLPQQVFSINCKIKSKMLSQDTEYACYFVFKLSEDCQGLHSPVEVRDLLRREKKEPEIIYFVSPRSGNLHDMTRVPEQRADGWMEVIVWIFNPNQELENDDIPVNLKLISYKGTISGLIVCGLEFRPM